MQRKFLIELRNVKKVYPLGKTEVMALKGVDFTIKEGEFVAVVGPSGSGKTTLLNIMGLLDHPTEGNMFFEERDVTNIKDTLATKIRRKRIGFIFQTFNLIPVLNASENVEIPLIMKRLSRKERREKIERIMDEVGLSDVINHKPDELSGGERQRVAIARALVSHPDIVFADEPTANLDTETGFQIIALMQKLNKIEGVTLVFSTHDERIVKMAKRKIILTDGKITYDSENSTEK
ncbi:ABC transporter ATP-binding protein [candidate division WOR-3 bacterium]|nr:ABC transporter ATP-binding protein [candidate division WOR-3 bacterium]HHD82838.1 ABC transporter ATP-binding protein [Bacteroidota bacterium]